METASISMWERASVMTFDLPERWRTSVVNSEMVTRCLACMADRVSPAFVIMPTKGAWSVNKGEIPALQLVAKVLDCQIRCQEFPIRGAPLMVLQRQWALPFPLRWAEHGAVKT